MRVIGEAAVLGVADAPGAESGNDVGVFRSLVSLKEHEVRMAALLFRALAAHAPRRVPLFNGTYLDGIWAFRRRFAADPMAQRMAVLGASIARLEKGRG